jgi:hypothetical protein
MAFSGTFSNCYSIALFPAGRKDYWGAEDWFSILHRFRNEIECGFAKNDEECGEKWY